MINQLTAEFDFLTLELLGERNRVDVLFENDGRHHTHLVLSNDMIKQVVTTIKRKVVKWDLEMKAHIIMDQCSEETCEKFLNGTYELYLTNNPEMPYFIKTSDDSKFYDVDASGTAKRRTKPDDMSGFSRLGYKTWRDFGG